MAGKWELSQKRLRKAESGISLKNKELVGSLVIPGALTDGCVGSFSVEMAPTAGFEPTAG
jgi:hypothetical protein